MTQKELARLLDISPRMVRALNRGDRYASPDLLARWHRVTGRGVLELIRAYASPDLAFLVSLALRDRARESANE